MKEVDRDSAYAQDFFDISAEYMTLWSHASTQQLERIRSWTDPDLHMTDFFFLAVALNNFERALQRHRDDLWRVIGTGRGSRNRRRAATCADNALAALWNGIPYLQGLRNVVSHLEEYAYGVGNQQPSRVPLRVDGTSSDVFIVENVAHSDYRFEVDLEDVQVTLEKANYWIVQVFVYFER